MLKTLFSHLISKGYQELGFGVHSVLRASSNLSNVSAEDFGVGERSTIKVSVGYTFSDFRRNNRLSSKKKYGSSLPFSSLYFKLVSLTGVSFVDVYFKTLFKARFDREVRAASRKLLTSIEAEKASLMASVPLTKSGAFDRRTSSYKKLANFSAWKSKALTDGFDEISIKIKKHIQQSLATGRIPLSFTHSDSTSKKRRSLGLTPLRAFFATGQLVDNLIVSYTADWA